jgi:hypothetical protein
MWDKIKATQADAQQKILAEKNLVTALAQELVTIRAEYRAREAASRSATPAEPQWNATEGRQPSIGLESALTQADKPPQRSVKVPDPPELTDGKSPKYQNWLLQMKNKLRANHDHYPDEAAKVAYIYGRTKDDASNLLYPHLQEEESSLTVKEAFDILDIAFVNPHREIRARDEYRSLLMKNSAFQEFYTKFLHLANEAKVPQEQRMDDMMYKLSYDLQRMLLPQRTHIKTLADLVSTCQLVDSESKALDARVNRRREVNKDKSKDIAKDNAKKDAIKDKKIPAKYEKDDSAKAALRKEGKCFKCQQAGHRANECPENIAQLSTDRYSDQESENE